MTTESELLFFTNRPPFELADSDETRMAQDEKLVTQIIGPRTTHTEITRILHQKILLDRDCLEKFSLGILNILLNTDNPSKFQQFFQSLQFLTQDGFESIILKLEGIVYLKFQALKPEAACNLVKIIHHFIKLKLSKIEQLIIICLRQVIIEDFSDKMQQYTKNFLGLLSEECDWIIANFKPIPLLFAKLIRMFSFALSAEINGYKSMILKLLQSIWMNKRDDCLSLGRELIRLMMEVFKAKEVEFITNDLKSIHPKLQIPLSEYLLKNKGETLNLPDIVRVLIPPYLDEILNSLHLHTPTENMPRIMRWIMRDFKIQTGQMNEFLMADITRFLVAAVFPPPEALLAGVTPRWKTIIYMLQVVKNELVRSLIKQNIFYDWMFYDSRDNNLALIEPGINIIKTTYYEHLPLCHELLDFLFISSKEYNPKNVVETKSSIRAAFGDSLRMGIVQTFDDLIYSEHLDFGLREKMSSFIPSEKNYEVGMQVDVPEPQAVAPADVIIDNGFKPNEEEYNPFGDFEGMDFDPLFKQAEVHGYDPDFTNGGLASVGSMEVESSNDKQVVTQSFGEKFKSVIQKINENPNKTNFEEFLKGFLQYAQSNQGDEDKYIKFAETLSDCYEDHFEDVLLTIEDNVIKTLLQHSVDALHTRISTYDRLKYTLRALYKVRGTVSFQYLTFYYKIIQSSERAFLEDYIALIGGERNFEPQLSEDIFRFYSVYSQQDFNEVIIRLIKDLSPFIIGRPVLIKSIIEISEASLTFNLEEELTCSTLKLFPEKLKELILNSTTWTLGSQETLWGLLTNQYNLSRKENLDLITDIRDVINDICRDANFNQHAIYGLLKGFRRFFNDALQNKDEKARLDCLVLMIDLHPNASFFLHSLFNLWDPHLVRVSLKEYAKKNGEEAEKIRNLGCHMQYMRSKRYSLKNGEIMMENYLKSILTKLFQKHKLDKEFKEVIEV